MPVETDADRGVNRPVRYLPVVDFDDDCVDEDAPLTELNAEWCRSEGVGSMWVGSLRT